MRAERLEQTFDLVIANGRVMDPESGLDAVRHVGIRNGAIEAITETPLAGARVIDASGHVVAPGFIDLRQHELEASPPSREGVSHGETSRSSPMGSEGW